MLHAELETTVQALLVRYAHLEERLGTAYLETAIEIAAFRGDRSDATAKALAAAAEHMLVSIDDLAASKTPEFDAASAAVDPYMVVR